MAKKKGAAPEAPRAKIVRQLTPEKDLNLLLKRARSTAQQVGEITGSFREKIADAVEKKHLHKKAFSVARALDKMEPDALAAFFDHFDHYCDVGGLRARAEDAPGLDLGDGDGEAEEGDAEPAAQTEAIEGRSDGRARGPRLVPDGRTAGDVG